MNGNGDAILNAAPERKPRPLWRDRHSTGAIPAGWFEVPSALLYEQSEVAVYVNKEGRLIVVGNPQDENHSCDLMGCAQDHVLFIGSVGPQFGTGEEETK